MEYKSKIKVITDIVFVFLIGFIIFISVKYLFRFLLPFVIGVLIASLVHKPSKYLAGRVMIKREYIAVILSVLLFLGLAFLCIYAVYGSFIISKKLLGNMNDIISEFYEIFENSREALSGFMSAAPKEFAEKINGIGIEMIENIGSKAASLITEYLTLILGKMPSFLFGLIVALVASCYIAKDYDRLCKFIKGLLSVEIRQKLSIIKNILSGSIFKIFKGYLILMLLTFIELLAGFLLIGIKNALWLSLIIAFVDLLPVFGTGAVLIPWGIVELFSDGRNGIKILLLYGFITVIRYFLEPKIVGAQIGINPLFMLIAMVSGLRILGFFGLIAFPLTLIVTIKYYKNQME